MRVLLVGYAPDAVDYSDPALPPGMNAEKIAAGIKASLEQMQSRGWQAEFCPVQPDDTAAPTVSEHLASASFDCIVVGGGVRMSSKGLAVFEAIINAVHRGASDAAIAFNSRPEDSADAVQRVCR